jgi:choline-sulfatase
LLRRLLDSPRFYYSLAALLAVIAIASQFRLIFPSRPKGSVDEIAKLPKRGDLNVVFILIDTLRADRLSAYGYKRETSPMMDQLAASGIVFANDQSQSTWTKCSMASLWTALYPPHEGVLRFDHAIPDAATMPAEVFKKAGYETVGIYRNGWVAPNFGFSQGFDVYLKPVPRQEPAKFQKNTPGAANIGGTDEDATEAAVQFLRTVGKRKFLLYVHYMDVHQYAYDDAAAKLKWGASISDTYDRSIHWVDSNVAAIVAELERRKLFQNTILVITADHGEGFLEHGTEGHARNLYNEVTHVPLIIALPFRLPQEILVKPTVRGVDVWPTILALTGLPPLPQTDGSSLLRLIEASAQGEKLPSRDVYAYLDQHWGDTKLKASPLISLQRGPYKVIYNTTEPERSLQIFDRATDPGEKHNLASKDPAWSKEMEGDLRTFAETQPLFGAAESVEVNDLDRGQLKALGYVIH